MIMDRNEILQSGLLELYVMGNLSDDDLRVVQNALAKDSLLVDELNKIEEAFFLYAQAHAVKPHPAVKPFLMAKIDYAERLKAGETPSKVPLLRADSTIDDFKTWINRGDIQLRDGFDGMQATIIAQEPEKLTALIWLAQGAPPEVHTTEKESFLVVEGSCDFIVGNDVHPLKAGDYLSIPLHVSHRAKVTSAIPCKIILQRVFI